MLPKLGETLVAASTGRFEMTAFRGRQKRFHLPLDKEPTAGNVSVVLQADLAIAICRPVLLAGKCNRGEFRVRCKEFGRVLPNLGHRCEGLEAWPFDS